MSHDSHASPGPSAVAPSIIEEIVDMTSPGQLREREIDLSQEDEEQHESRPMCAGCNCRSDVSDLTAAFPCGHCLCSACTDDLSTSSCDVCMWPVERKIKLYFDGHCVVCFRSARLNELTAYVPCGHCVCRDCHDELEMRRFECALCRHMIDRSFKPLM